MKTGILSNIIELVINSQEPEKRNYVGASLIGHPCERLIWYKINHPEDEKFSSKQLRTFEIGKNLESMVLDLMEKANIPIIRNWPEISESSIPMFKGHADAVLTDLSNNPVAIIEIKTARDSSFKIFLNEGLKKWSNSYYAQLQSYMGMSGIHEGYLIALNKDTSEIHDEYVAFDEKFYEVIKDKVNRVLTYNSAPNKINSSPLYYLFNTCSFKQKCHGEN